MNRRRFLQALFAAPCLAAPLLVPTVVPEAKTWTSGWMKAPESAYYVVKWEAGSTFAGTLTCEVDITGDGNWVAYPMVPSTALIGEGG